MKDYTIKDGAEVVASELANKSAEEIFNTLMRWNRDAQDMFSSEIKLATTEGIKALGLVSQA